MNTISRSPEEFANEWEDCTRAYSESSKEFIDEANLAIESVIARDLARSMKNEVECFSKLQTSYWFTRWYYKKKYRQARLKRIKIERFYNQKFRKIC